MSKTLEQQARFIQMRAKNYSFKSISIELKVSVPTLIKWQTSFEKQIANTRFLEIENIRAQATYTRTKKLETFQKMIDSIYAEIETKQIELSQMEIPLLLELLSKFENLKSKELENLFYHTNEMANFIFTEQEKLLKIE